MSRWAVIGLIIIVVVMMIIVVADALSVTAAK